MRFNEFRVNEIPDDGNRGDLAKPEAPESNNSAQGNPMLQNIIKGLFAGFVATMINKVAGSNPQFADLIRTILSGNTDGFNPQQVIGMAPPAMRNQVQKALQNVDPETGNIIDASADAPTGPGADNSSGWTTITVGDKTYEVGNDYYKVGGVYKRMSAAAADSTAKANNWIVPTRDIIRAIYSKATIVPMPLGDPSKTTDEEHTAKVNKMLKETGASGLIAGHMKDMFRGEDGGIGMIGGAKSGGGFWQSLGGNGRAHSKNPGYDDYSQGLRPVRLPRNGTNT